MGNGLEWSNIILVLLANGIMYIMLMFIFSSSGYSNFIHLPHCWRYEYIDSFLNFIISKLWLNNMCNSQKISRFCLLLLWFSTIQQDLFSYHPVIYFYFLSLLSPINPFIPSFCRWEVAISTDFLIHIFLMLFILSSQPPSALSSPFYLCSSFDSHFSYSEPRFDASLWCTVFVLRYLSRLLYFISSVLSLFIFSRPFFTRRDPRFDRRGVFVLAFFGGELAGVDKGQEEGRAGVWGL